MAAQRRSRKRSESAKSQRLMASAAGEEIISHHRQSSGSNGAMAKIGEIMIESGIMAWHGISSKHRANGGEIMAWRRWHQPAKNGNGAG
jgi:hypothetical protein